MEYYGQQRPERRRRQGLLALLLAGSALISATGATMSLALFTSTVSANNNSFTAGTIVLGVAPSPIILTSASMMPGDNVQLEVELITPVALEKGLRFAIREGGRTVGAGTVSEIVK